MLQLTSKTIKGLFEKKEIQILAAGPKLFQILKTFYRLSTTLSESSVFSVKLGMNDQKSSLLNRMD